MSFRDIKGQDKAIAFLKGAMANNRLSHAYIFLGPAGIGKRLVALNFAKALNCLADPDSRPCDACSSCKKIDASSHPDVSISGPDKEGSSVKIERIREIIKDIGLKSYEARTKVYIIDGAEALTQEASNALLKTLEEPPSDAVIILIAERIETLLPTIASRAQHLKFSPLGINEIRKILTEDHKLDREKAHILSHLSAGSIGRALEYKDGGLFDVRSRLMKGLADGTLFDSDFDEVSRKDLKTYLDIMLTWYRDLLVAKAGGSTLVNIDEEKAIAGEAKRLEFKRIDEMIKEIISTSVYLDENANPKLAMSVLGLKASGEGR